MKKSFLLILILVLASCESEPTETIEEPCDGGIFVVENENRIHKLFTQSDVNAFGEMCYTKIDGGLSLYDLDESDKILDLTPLESITEIYNGRLRISASDLVSLNGLQNLTQVDGLGIIFCENLENLYGLSSLEVIGNESYNETVINPGLLDITLSSITSLEGLESLTTVDWLNISSNANLMSLNGLENLIEVKGYFNPEFQAGIFIGIVCIDIPCGPFMNDLTDFCALQNLFANGVYLEENVSILWNGYNPSVQDIIDGNCSL